MHPSILLLFLLPLSAASHFTNHRPTTTTTPQEHIEVARPLPFSSLTPACTLPLLSHSFADSLSLPPTNSSYSPPPNCTWSHAALHLSASINGSQYDRIAAVWLAGAELLRTSTPEPTPQGVFWRVRKDVTRYSSLLRQPNLTLSVMLENIVNDVYTGVYTVNVTFLYYNLVGNETGNNSTAGFPLPKKSTLRKLKIQPLSVLKNASSSLVLDENPADLIVPISASGEEGFWFSIKSDLDAVYQGVRIPPNTYRAVIEVYVSFHGDDEFWYSNPPDAYIDMNRLPTKRGHGAYREVLVKLDDNVVGTVVPFPVVFTGGINPLFWEPVVSIGAFDLPTYEIELTPFLGMLLDGKVHFIGLGVADAISYWLVDANLHLWLDGKADKVQAGAIKYSEEGSSVERESKFQQLDGKFEVESEWEGEFSGWVNSSAGNLTTYVSRKVEFENTIKFTNGGTEKSVKQEVKIKSKVRVENDMGYTISSVNVESKYPLKMTTTKLPGSAPDTYLMTTKLENSIKEEKEIDKVKSSLANSQECDGWMFVQDHDVLSGAATTSQSLSVVDSLGCYNRKVLAEGGLIKNDTEGFLCAVAS